MPEQSINAVTEFMEGTNFLTLFIAVLITGSVLSVERKLLLKALVGYIPTIVIGVAGAMLFGVVAGLLTGISPTNVLTMYVLPIMGGGTGAGALPMSEIYSSVTGNDPSQFLSFAFPILTIANIVAIIIAALLNKLGEKRPSLAGNGELVRNKDIDAKQKKVDIKLQTRDISAGFILSISIYLLGVLMSRKLLPTIFGVLY